MGGKLPGSCSGRGGQLLGAREGSGLGKLQGAKLLGGRLLAGKWVGGVQGGGGQLVCGLRGRVEERAGWGRAAHARGQQRAAGAGWWQQRQNRRLLNELNMHLHAWHLSASLLMFHGPHRFALCTAAPYTLLTLVQRSCLHVMLRLEFRNAISNFELQNEHKEVKVDDILGSVEAKKIVKDALNMYQEHYVPKKLRTVF